MTVGNVPTAIRYFALATTLVLVTLLLEPPARLAWADHTPSCPIGSRHRLGKTDIACAAAAARGGDELARMIWTPDSPLPQVQRYGLNRSDNESEIKGQLMDNEIERLVELAKWKGERIILSGSLSSSNYELAARYVLATLMYGKPADALELTDGRLVVRSAMDDGPAIAEAARRLRIPDWRAVKPTAHLVRTGIGDVDLVMHLSGRVEVDRRTGVARVVARLSSATLRELKRIFPCSEFDTTGYSKTRYPTFEDLKPTNGGPGAIIFEPDGRYYKLQATWGQ